MRDLKSDIVAQNLGGRNEKMLQIMCSVTLRMLHGGSSLDKKSPPSPGPCDPTSTAVRMVQQWPLGGLEHSGPGQSLQL